MEPAKKPFRLTGTFLALLVGDFEHQLQPLFIQGAFMDQFTVSKNRKHKMTLSITYGHSSTSERHTVHFRITAQQQGEEVVLSIDRLKNQAIRQTTTVITPVASASQAWASQSTIDTILTYLRKDLNLSDLHSTGWLVLKTTTDSKKVIMTKAHKLTPVHDIAMAIRKEKKIDFTVINSEPTPQHNHYEGYTQITREGTYEWFNGEKILSVSEITGHRVDEEGHLAEEADTLDYWWATYYPAESTPENPAQPEYESEGGTGSAEELKSIILDHMQTITATILDTGTTLGYLVVELPEGEFVRVELTDEMEDTADAIPDLVQVLEKAGYRFKDEPTDHEGDVQLERI